MRRLAKFLAMLLIGLSVIAWIAYGALTSITAQWFEEDLQLRSRLALTSARPSLLEGWSGKLDRPTQTLRDISRDERIMGATTCSASDLPAGRVQPTSLSVRELAGPPTIVLLIQALRFLGRREATTCNLLFLGFFLLAPFAALVIAAALQMPSAEQVERMRSMRRLVREFNVYRWAGACW